MPNFISEDQIDRTFLQKLMRFRIHLLNAALLLALTAPVFAATSDPAVVLDTAAIDAWLACANSAGCNPAAREGQSASTLGGKLAELAKSSFGPLPVERPEEPPLTRVSALVQAMKTWNLAEIAGEMQGLFPAMEPRDVRIFVVGNGVPVWGDMYVRQYSFDRGEPRLDANGEPVIIINARLNAAYSGTPEALAEQARDVVRHEIFHVFFARYRAQDRRWQGVSFDESRQLLLVVQDEGVAHYLAMQRRCRKDGFPVPRAREAMKTLAECIQAIQTGTASEELLHKANEGPFWQKYGAISGALFAYGIDKHYGSEGLRESLVGGPSVFILRYDDACARDASLPRMDPGVREWAVANQTMLMAPAP